MDCPLLLLSQPVSRKSHEFQAHDWLPAVQGSESPPSPSSAPLGAVLLELFLGSKVFGICSFCWKQADKDGCL